MDHQQFSHQGAPARQPLGVARPRKLTGTGKTLPQVKIITHHDPQVTEDRVNSWLEQNAKSIEVEEIKLADISGWRTVLIFYYC